MSSAALEHSVLRTLKSCAGHGLTVREFLLSEIVPGAHHGQVSAAFSNLHRDGVIECLQARRSGYCIYVMPRHAKGVPVRAHRSVKRLSRRDALLMRADNVEEVLSDGYSVSLIENLHDLLAEIERQYR